MKLYEITGDFSDLYDRFIDIDAWEPDTDEDGRPIDENGDIIENVTAYKEAMFEAWFDTLEGIEELFENKAVNVAVYIKNLRSEAEQIKAEKLKLEKRQSAKNKLADRLEKYLFDSMQKVKRTQIDRPQAKIRIKQNPESTVIESEQEFIKWAESTEHDDLLKYEQPKIRKTEVKALIRRSVEKIPFAHLERETVIEIK